MATDDKKSSPLVEKFDSKNRKGSDSENPEKFSSAGGLADSKKLDDIKETPENKAAIAEAEGKNLNSDSTDSSDSEKVKSKPAVAKVSKDKKVEAKAELEREYIVPMRKGFMNVPHYRRAKKAVKTLKEFMVKHMNVRDNDTRKIKVDIHLNNEIWFRGIKKPLAKIKVKAIKKDGLVYVTLADPADYVKFKMARETKAVEVAGRLSEVGKGKTGETKKSEEKDKDGVDDKKEEAEDKKSGAEKAAKSAKVDNKDLKHSAKGEHKQKIASTKGLK